MAAWNRGISVYSVQSGPGEETAKLLWTYEGFFLNSSLPGFLLEICVPKTQRLKKRGKTVTLIAVFLHTHPKSYEILSAKEHA